MSTKPIVKAIDKEHEIIFTVHIRTTGRKVKCVQDLGRTLTRILYLSFGDRYRIFDHRNREIPFDPNAHDYGYGEA